MKPHRQILNRVGTTLILLGAVQWYLMIWEFFPTNPSDVVQQYFLIIVLMAFVALIVLGIMYVLPGILLLRGGLLTANYLRYIALFGLTANLVYCLLTPLLAPFGYHMVLLKQMPISFAEDVWSDMVYLGIIFWLQALLGRDEVANAQVDARITPAAASPTLWVGGACGLLFVGLMYWAFHGSSSEEAIERVKADQGTKYNYFVDGFHCSIGESTIKITVEVVGYNSQEIENFTVDSASSL